MPVETISETKLAVMPTIVIMEITCMIRTRRKVLLRGAAPYAGIGIVKGFES